ncbi:glycosyltransferase family 4 protein [Massilia aerilata]|uniref:Glycosyltransferase family 4 protein n=1 Tax=Massilia aerilata TaxID=453817 RepID=A0ABW0RUD8_9BURK
MNILLINHYAGSVRHGMEYRPYYLAREWVRQGHKVTIVASSESHVRTLAPSLGGAAQLQETIAGIDYLWLATPPYRGNGLARVRNMAAFVMRLRREGAALAARLKPDAVIASSTYPLDIWPAHRIARLAGARLLFELHDLWPLSPMELGGYSRWHPFIMLLQAAENFACRRADAIVSILPRVREHLEAHGMAPSKLHLVPNGVDPAEWEGAPAALPAALADTLDELHRQGKFVVGYAGTHGISNALETLLEAAARLRGQPVAFVLVGGGPDKPALLRQAIELGLENVHFFEPVPKAQVPALLARFDLAYIGWRRQPLYRFGISPNKLIDYMMAARPILHAVEAGNDPVAEAGCGLTVPPEHPQAVADGILNLLAMGAECRAVLGQRGRRFALANHTYPVLGRRFLNAFAGEPSHG